MEQADAYARFAASSLPAHLKPVQLPRLADEELLTCTQDVCDQDVSESPVFSAWECPCSNRPFLVVLPGAWAMGDGIILETEGHSNPSFSDASSKREPWNVESFGTGVVRFAGSVSSSLSYLADLTLAWTNDIDTAGSDMDKTAYPTLIEGEIAWVPRASSSRVPSEKKQK